MEQMKEFKDGVPMLRTREILDRIAASESHWRRLEGREQCPVRARLGSRARGLPEDVLDLWLTDCLVLRSTLTSLTDPITLPRWVPDPKLTRTVYPRGIQMLRLTEVELLVGLGHTAIYDAIRDWRFPRPAPLGDRVRRWPRHEIDEWLAARHKYLTALRAPGRVWSVPTPPSAPAR